MTEERRTYLFGLLKKQFGKMSARECLIAGSIIDEAANLATKELQEELEQAKKVKVVEHFEAYGQCRDSRRIAGLEKQLTEAKEIVREFYNSFDKMDPTRDLRPLIAKAKAFLKE